MFKKLFGKKEEPLIYSDTILINEISIDISKDRSHYLIIEHDVKFSLITGSLESDDLINNFNTISSKLDYYDKIFKEGGAQDIISFLNSLEIDFEEEEIDLFDLIDNMTLNEVYIVSDDYVEFIYSVNHEHYDSIKVIGDMALTNLHAHLRD